MPPSRGKISSTHQNPTTNQLIIKPENKRARAKEKNNMVALFWRRGTPSLLSVLVMPLPVGPSPKTDGAPVVVPVPVPVPVGVVPVDGVVVPVPVDGVVVPVGVVPVDGVVGVVGVVPPLVAVLKTQINKNKLASMAQICNQWGKI